jgi:hypothetical protein
MYNLSADFINDSRVWEILEANQKADFGKIREVLAKAREMKGLNMADVAVLTGISDPEMLSELFQTANEVKETIYGKRLVLFARFTFRICVPTNAFTVLSGPPTRKLCAMLFRRNTLPARWKC